MNKGVKQALKRIQHIFLNINPIKENFCCLCNAKVGTWLPYKGGWKKAPILMKTLDIIGSDLDNFTCRSCGSHDRERHLWLYLQESGIQDEIKDSYILHFAPEIHLSAKLNSLKPKKYIKADLYPKFSDIEKIDMLSIPYDDNTFNFVIANHVLEHVPNYHKALQEIYRVLKTNGLAILQTPYSNVLKNTWEDIGIETDKQRLQAYGQEDHMRLFGKDIINEITKVGFTSHAKSHSELISKSTKKYGINPSEPFLLFKK